MGNFTTHTSVGKLSTQLVLFVFAIIWFCEECGWCLLCFPLHRGNSITKEVMVVELSHRVVLGISLVPEVMMLVSSTTLTVIF